MKKPVIVFALLLSTVSIAFAQQQPQRVRIAPLSLTSSGFADGTAIPLKFTQAASVPDGEVSPELTWSTPPTGTQSFVVWMHDLDYSVKRTTEDNLHWMVWNIPASSTSLQENLPIGAHLDNGIYQISYNRPGYRGPGAPASGPLHHYIFELYALDIKLDEAAAATPVETREKIFKLMQGHVLGKAAYGGLFRRPQ